MFLVWCLVPRILGAGCRAYEPTALKVPHPHVVPEVVVNKESPLKGGGFVIHWCWAKKERPH